MQTIFTHTTSVDKNLQGSFICKHHNNKYITVYKFVQKYRFKGSWDVMGKVFKQRILNNELKNCRWATDWGCYIKLSKDPTKNRDKARIK